MHKVLIVDDEPLICEGLGSLLLGSGLPIRDIFTAKNGYEALDYLRLEEIDLIVTDIRMDAMNGIELMQQAKIMKPWVETVVVSAHEDFHYARQALRLGARDYLLKPLDSEQFLDAVRNALLKMSKFAPPEEHLSRLREDFAMKEPDEECARRMNALLAGELGREEAAGLLRTLQEKHGISMAGPYFSVLKIRLQLSPEQREDAGLYRYAALNIVSESLGADWTHVPFYSREDEITVVLQWSEREYAEANVNKIAQLEMIGRSLYRNIHKHLNVRLVIGISQILMGHEFLRVLNEQADRAIRWNARHDDYNVFYYGDLHRDSGGAEPSEEDIQRQLHSIVQNAQKYILEHYHQKGLTLNEIAQKSHVSPNYLSYLFKKYTGFNLWEYVIKLRMEEAKRLLVTTDLRRYEIAERVGYESPEHFSKIFKKYFGKSPSELKK